MTNLAEKYRAEIGPFTVIICEIEPQPAPTSGNTWPAELDYVRAELTLSVASVPYPNTDSPDRPRTAIPEGLRFCTQDRGPRLILLGELLWDQWGTDNGDNPDYDNGDRRERCKQLAAPKLSDAVRQLRELAEAQLAPVLEAIEQRSLRLAARERALEFGRDC